MEALNALTRFYENYDEDNRLCSRYGMVEYLTTLRYIEKYLSSGMRILEIGAATGKYSHYFAQRGYQVDAVELIGHNIELFKRNTQPGENVTITQGNAKDLNWIGDDTYDITLVVGPMYHLFTDEEKLQALGEAVRVTKRGGIIFSAYCMGDASVLLYGFVRGEIHNIIQKCMLDPVTFETFSQPWDLFELYRKEDIDHLRNHFNVTQLHYLATDGYANHMRSTLDAMDKDTFALFLRYHFATCERPDMTGYFNHTLDIFRKD